MSVCEEVESQTSMRHDTDIFEEELRRREAAELRARRRIAAILVLASTAFILFAYFSAPTP